MNETFPEIFSVRGNFCPIPTLSQVNKPLFRADRENKKQRFYACS